MMNRPVTVVSPSHGVAIAAYLGQGLLAIQLMQGIATTKALDQAIGFGAQWAVPTLMLLASIGALCAAWAIAQGPALVPALRLDAVATAVLGVHTLAYAFSLTATYGWQGGATTQTYAWSIGAGFLIRSAQSVRDLTRVQRAAAAGVPASPAPLGEPDDSRR